MVSRDRRSAGRPVLEWMAGRPIGAVVVEQGDPRLLLALRREGQMTDGAHINLPTPIKGANARQQITERENALHSARLEPDGIGNLFDAAPRLHQSDKALPLADLVGPNPREIFEHRPFQPKIGRASWRERGG